jgi:hypothetical protein
MKKIAIATMFALVAATASAVEIGAEYQNFEGKNGTGSSNNYQLSVKEQLNSNLGIDLKATDAISKTTSGISNASYESGVTGKYNLGFVTPYTRVSVGQWIKSTDNFTYYGVEPGVLVPIASTGLTASVGWRYRNSFHDVNEFETRTWRAKISYAVTKTDNIYVGYDRMRGDIQANVGLVGYSHSF